MNLDFKKAFKDVFSLKYFWVYLFIFAVVTSLTSIVQGAKSMPYHTSISNIISVFTNISSGYLLIMVHNLLNNNELNDETFAKSFWNSTKKGFKAFLGTLTNTIIVFTFGSLIAIAATLIFIKITKNVVTEMNLFSFPILNVIFVLIVLLISIFMLFVMKLLPIAYSKEYSLKEMFCWRKVFKAFFQKGKSKDTFLVLLSYIFILLISFAVLWGITFIFDLIMVYFTKVLLINHYMAYLIITHISNVIGPFIIGMFHFCLQGVIYHLLSQVYGR